ncbi:hypothetical protein GNY06_09710 [Elizabethkingia argentiflava]|uniref:Tetratricopeptide repeat protein n=1 Tax=Elizabethkingia argenteiflava TaxID=2681556 RepID=A0A845PTS9_9FLAO|nr:hypothetical protein [Elizabethkingia argenteiflava]NAW51639.1 hypothetical protein [Elizabethkingia argenteiflava]
MQKNIRFYSLFLYFIAHHICFSQSIKGFRIQDSLQDKSFAQLEKAYNKVKNKDQEKAVVYANTILTKAKEERNTAKLFDGYFLLFDRSGKDIKYTDSIRYKLKGIKNLDDLYYGYFINGRMYYTRSLYKEALSSYLLALEYAQKNKNEKQIVFSKKAIGAIKYAIEDYEGALVIFRQNYQYIKRR